MHASYASFPSIDEYEVNIIDARARILSARVERALSEIIMMDSHM